MSGWRGQRARWIAGVCGIATAVAVGAGALVVRVFGQETVFRSASEIVRVFVTVTDRDRLVTNLTQGSFELRDEGKVQPIVVFDNSPKPIRLITMLDVSGSMAGNLPLLRAAAEQLFARLRPDDVARVGSFGREVSVGPEFTRDVTSLRKSLPTAIDPEAPTPLWRAINDAIGSFGEAGDDRRVILVLTDGKDSGPLGLKKADRYVSQVEVIDHARVENVMIYAIGMASRGRRAPGPIDLREALSADLPDPGLGRVAEETGGGYTEVRLNDDLGAAFARVADELHSQYLLGFAPPKRDGKVHEIQVKAKEGGKVRARKGYVAPADKKP